MNTIAALTRHLIGDVAVVALGVYLSWLYNYIKSGGVYLELMDTVELSGLILLHLALIYSTLKLAAAL